MITMTCVRKSRKLRWPVLGVVLVLACAPLAAAEVGQGPAESRAWTSADGKFHTQARLIEVRKESVVLEKAGGVQITVPRSGLSREDLAYLERQAAPAVQKAAAAATGHPKTPLDRDFRKEAAAYITRILNESYLKGGKTSPAWDADARRMFDMRASVIAYKAYNPVWITSKLPTRDELHALERAVSAEGCKDSWIFMTEANRIGRPQGDDVSSMDALGQSVADMLRHKEYPGLSRRIIYHFLCEVLFHAPGIHDKVCAEMKSRKDLDPWLAAMLSGTLEMGLAAQYGGPGPDPQAARAHYLAAWKVCPENPEAAVSLMRMAGHGEPGDTPRAWFDRAIAAQFDWEPAYTQMIQQLANQGGPEKMHAFGLECLKTGRFDTDVPERYLIALFGIELVTRSDSWWRRPEVRENLHEFFRKSAEDPTPRNLDYLTSQAAYCFCRCGDYAAALQAFEKVGGRLDRNYFKLHNLDANAALAQCRSQIGPQAAGLKAADEAAAAGQPEKAAAILRRAVAKLDKSDKSRPYLRGRLVAAEIESALATGKWVSIQPPADLAGWSVACGEWSVDEQGALVGKSDATKASPRDSRGMMLFCQAKAGSRFELRGHAEILEPHEDGGSFGAVIGYSDAQRYWQCHFYPPRGKETVGTAYVLCSIHRNPHMRYAKVGRSDDFRVQVYDDRVVTTVGDETRAEQGPFAVMLDHDPPSDSTSYGVGGCRPLLKSPPNVVRFTKLELRKLAEPPPAKKVVEPGANGAHIDR
jgi:tetratricopeptide (TPR) repeat protein